MTKKFLEAADKDRKKTWNETEEVSKRNELLSGFEGKFKKRYQQDFQSVGCSHASIHQLLFSEEDC